MSLHIPLFGETLPAAFEWALKGLIPVMGAKVHLQPALLRVAFSAAGKSAFVILSLLVNGVMRVQLCLLHEGLVSPSESALVWLIFIMDFVMSK